MHTVFVHCSEYRRTVKSGKIWRSARQIVSYVHISVSWSPGLARPNVCPLIMHGSLSFLVSAFVYPSMIRAAHNIQSADIPYFDIKVPPLCIHRLHVIYLNIWPVFSSLGNVSKKPFSSDEPQSSHDDKIHPLQINPYTLFPSLVPQQFVNQPPFWWFQLIIIIGLKRIIVQLSQSYS